MTEKPYISIGETAYCKECDAKYPVEVIDKGATFKIICKHHEEYPTHILDVHYHANTPFRKK